MTIPTKRITVVDWMKVIRNLRKAGMSKYRICRVISISPQTLTRMEKDPDYICNHAKVEHNMREIYEKTVIPPR